MDIETAAIFLGVERAALLPLKAANDHKSAGVGLEIFKTALKKAWKRKAFELHPDRGGDETKFIEAKEIFDVLMRLKVRPPPPPARTMTIVFHAGWPMSTSTSYTTGGTGSW